MNACSGWATRLFGTVFAAAAGWFLVAHSGDLLPAVGKVAALGPYVLPGGLALVLLGVLNRGLQARASYRLVELPATIGAMTSLSASSYATNKVVKSGGTAGLVPYLTHADRSGHCRARVVAAYMSAKLAETVSLCALILLAVALGAATGGLHGTALFGAIASSGYALIVGVSVVLLASRRSVVELFARVGRRCAHRARALLRKPHPEPGPSAAVELADALARLRSDPRAASPLLATAFVGKLLGFFALCIVLAGLGIHLSLATTLLVYTLTLMAALAGPLPGGIGIADASLGALLVANGVRAPAAAAAVIAFRLLDLWLPLLAGAVAWTGQLRVARRDTTAAATGPALIPVVLPLVPASV